MKSLIIKFLIIFITSISSSSFANIENNNEPVENSMENQLLKAREDPDVLDWRTFTNANRVCLAKQGYAEIKHKKVRKLSLTGIGIGAAASFSVVLLPISYFLTIAAAVVAPYAVTPAVIVGGYYAYKHQKQNNRQDMLLRLMMTPEKEPDHLFKMHAHFFHYKGSISIKENYENYFNESMKTVSYLCNENGSLKSFKKSLNFYPPKNRDVNSSENNTNMTTLEVEIAQITAEYMKYKSARSLLKRHYKLLEIAKTNHQILPFSDKAKENLLQREIHVNDYVEHLKSNNFLSSHSSKTNAKVALKDLKKSMKEKYYPALNLVHRWIQDEGNILAAEHIKKYNREILSYPKLTNKQKYLRWKYKNQEEKILLKKVKKMTKAANN